MQFSIIRIMSVVCVMLSFVVTGCATQQNPNHVAATELAHSNAPQQNLYDMYMEEQRQWAGLVSKTLQVKEGVEIVYSEGGNKDAPTLVLLHGYYGDRNNWNQVVHQLQDKYHFIIPDLPGHGDSSQHPQANYSVAEMAFVMSDLVEQLGIDQFNLAGHSMGGAVAIQWTMAHQNQVKNLILMDAAGKYTDNRSEIMQQILAGNNPMRIAQPGDAAKVLAFAMERPPFVPAKVMRDFEAKQVARTQVYDKVMTDMLARDKTLNVRFFNTALKLFDMPVLVLWGDQDAIFSVDVTKQYMSWLPNGKLVLIPGIGHSPLMEAPWPTSQAIAQFLN